MGELPPFNPDTVAGPRFAVSVEYTDEMLMRVYKTKHIGIVVLVGAFLFLFCSFIAGWDWKSNLLGFLVVGILVSIIGTLSFKPSCLKANEFIRKWDYHRELTFDDCGVLHVSAIGNDRLRWNMFTRVVRSKDMWVLYLGKKIAILIPVSLISSDLQDFIVRKCSENGVKVK